MPDPRCGNAQRHDLLDILTIALAASVCGAETCVDFAEFVEDREPLLREFLRPPLTIGVLTAINLAYIFAVVTNLRAANRRR